MNYARITALVISITVAGLMLTRDTLAGTTATVDITSFAREVGAENAVYTMPANTVTRLMGIARTSAQDFFIDVTLGNGLEFAVAPVESDLGLTISVGGAVTISSVILTNGDTTARFFVDVTTDFAGNPTFTLSTTGWQLRDVSNRLGIGGRVQITVETRDSFTTLEFDSGIDTVDWLVGEFGVAVGQPLVSTTALISATTNENFIVAFPDTAVQDNGASLGLEESVANVFDLTGSDYGLVAGDSLDLFVSGDLSGITSITWKPGASEIVDNVTPDEVTAGSTTLSIPGGNISLDGSKTDIRITVNGTTSLSVRTVSITVNLALSGGAGGPAENDRTVLSTATLSTWGLEGADTVPPETSITDGPFGDDHTNQRDFHLYRY